MDARDNQSKTQLLTRRNTECNDFKYKGDKSILSNDVYSAMAALCYVMLLGRKSMIAERLNTKTSLPGMPL